MNILNIQKASTHNYLAEPNIKEYKWLKTEVVLMAQ